MASITVNLEGFDEIQKKLARAATRAEHLLAVQVQKDTERYVPALTKKFIDDTKVYGNTIVYPGPQARYLHEGKVMVDAATGKGPMKIVGEGGVELIRFRKGAVLKPIDRELNIKTSVNPDAQSHWCDASIANNKDKWLRVAGKMVRDEL